MNEKNYNNGMVERINDIDGNIGPQSEICIDPLQKVLEGVDMSKMPEAIKNSKPDPETIRRTLRLLMTTQAEGWVQKGDYAEILKCKNYFSPIEMSTYIFQAYEKLIRDQINILDELKRENNPERNNKMIETERKIINKYMQDRIKTMEELLEGTDLEESEGSADESLVFQKGVDMLTLLQVVQLGLVSQLIFVPGWYNLPEEERELKIWQTKQNFQQDQKKKKDEENKPRNGMLFISNGKES